MKLERYIRLFILLLSFCCHHLSCRHRTSSGALRGQVSRSLRRRYFQRERDHDSRGRALRLWSRAMPRACMNSRVCPRENTSLTRRCSGIHPLRKRQRRGRRPTAAAQRHDGNRSRNSEGSGFRHCAHHRRESRNNAGAIVISGKELEALPDDPDELQSDLEALAGPSAGPNGGQMYIDGFTAGQLPPKSSIREIRINQNPFSSEYDKLGYGRIEIFTKPGTDKYHGQFFILGNDSAFNSHNPFAGRRSPVTIPPNTTAISAARWARRHLSFSTLSAATSMNSTAINAIVLDPNLDPSPA